MGTIYTKWDIMFTFTCYGTSMAPNTQPIIYDKTVSHSILRIIGKTESGELRHVPYYILPISNTNMIKGIVQPEHCHTSRYNEDILYALR
ncbi:uncharacterized protein METZ01_LOCUS49592 [marine metagenome]|uniref:Uncharacterized protein n=1 Tax=marine metagenome TaxID=408172 RepID=A0A381S094_9ZZZZ